MTRDIKWNGIYRIRSSFIYGVIAVLATTSSIAGAGSPMSAQPYFALCTSDNRAQTVAVRRYVGAKRMLLVVNTASLLTRLTPDDSCQCTTVSRHSFDSAIANTDYGHALKDAARRDIPVQDAGIIRTTPTLGGIDLTVDLCPSHRPLEREFFTRLVNAFSAEEKPIPLAIAITGVWMKEHPNDLGWLLNMVHRGDLSITWINHSFSHRFDPHLPLHDNFLLEKGTDPRGEILKNELAMIERQMTPSAFFRFPGLVSDRAAFDSVIAYGLIPVGSDAWLAKGQRPSPGSIVLIHGNGNEPLGINKFFGLIAQHAPEIRMRRWLLFDLRESVVREEEGK
jgi:hypothetical protein